MTDGVAASVVARCDRQHDDKRSHADRGAHLGYDIVKLSAHLIVIVLVVVACAAPPAAPHQPALGNAVATPEPRPGAPCGLDWLADVRELRLSEVTSGHFGLTSFHVDIERRHDLPDFEGVVLAAYREYPDREPRSIAKRVTYKQADVIDPLVAMRDAMTI